MNQQKVPNLEKDFFVLLKEASFPIKQSVKWKVLSKDLIVQARLTLVKSKFELTLKVEEASAGALVTSNTWKPDVDIDVVREWIMSNNRIVF